MSRLLYRLGRGAALHPWRTLGLWVLAATLGFGLASVAGGKTHDDWDGPNPHRPPTPGHDPVEAAPTPGGDGPRLHGLRATDVRRRRHRPDHGVVRLAGH